MVKRNDDGTTNSGDYCEVMFETDNNGDSVLEDGEDVKWRSTDTTGSDTLTDYGVLSGAWDDGSFTGNVGQDSASDLDSGDSDITYEFKIYLEDVFGSSPPYNKPVGFGVFVWDNDASTGDWWPDSGSPSGTNPSTWGDLTLPEFSDIIVPISIVMAIFVIRKKSRKKRSNL